MALDQWGNDDPFNRQRRFGGPALSDEITNDGGPSTSPGANPYAKGGGSKAGPGGGGLPGFGGSGSSIADATSESGLAANEAGLGASGAVAPAATGGTPAWYASMAKLFGGVSGSKAIPWLELLYGIYKGQQHGSFEQPPTSPWQDKIFGKYYDWMTGGSPTNAALSPAILEMMKSTNPEFTLPNLIGPEAGKNVFPNGGHVGGANVDWNALLSRLTAGGTPPATAAPPVAPAVPMDGVLGKKYDWMTP